MDTVAGMTFSEIVAYFVILATGATLFNGDHVGIRSATDAAQALRPLAGDLSTVLLAVGLIGAGVLAVPILTGSAAYAVSEAFGWQSGLSRRPGRALGFYLVIVAATLVGMAINFVGIDPIDALGDRTNGRLGDGAGDRAGSAGAAGDPDRRVRRRQGSAG